MENLRLGAKIGLKWVFIPFLIILVMSHNAGAIDLTQEVYHIRGNMIISGYCSDCSNLTDIQGSNSLVFVNNNQDLSGIIRTFYFGFDNETFNSGDYFTFDSYVFVDQNNNSLDAWVKSLKTTSSGWDLVNTEFSQISTGSGKLTLTFRAYTTGTYSGLYVSSTSNSWLNLYYKEYFTTGVGTHWRPAAGVDYSQAIQNVVNAINSQPNYSTALNDIKNSIQNQNQEEEDAVQDAADDASDAAAANSTNTATTNLVGVLSSFLSAITNFSATDCNVTLAFPSYAGGSMTFNVCQYKDKAGNLISVFTSLTLIVFYLPLAIKLLSMIYNEIRSFTNG